MMKFVDILLCIGVVFCAGCFDSTKSNLDGVEITQLTFSEKDCILGLFDAWSPDDNWVVFCNGANETNDTIAKVNVNTGEIVTLYHIDNQMPYGPGCGTPSYCHTEDKVVFIHGPSHCSPQQKYEFWRRSGGSIEEPNLNELVRLDARDVTYPFTPGASRGGTHCHEWSHDGDWVAFTYNDMIMADLEKQTTKTLNLRTIGVSADMEAVEVDEDTANENFDGKFFTVILVDVVPEPKRGSDEISKAYENCWLGHKGYKTSQGKWQRAVAFKGKTVDQDGNEVPEVYIVDVPDDITKPGIGPLEGTENHMPYPPEGAKVTRLTYTSDRKYPGLSTNPRFWLRSSQDGSKIFFLARDDEGLNQVYYVDVHNKSINQVTHHNFDVTSTVSVCPDGKRISYVADKSVFVTSLEGGNSVRITEKLDKSPSIPIWSNAGDKMIYKKTVSKPDGKKSQQIFIITGV